MRTLKSLLLTLTFILCAKDSSAQDGRGKPDDWFVTKTPPQAQRRRSRSVRRNSYPCRRRRPRFPRAPRNANGRRRPTI